LRVSFLSRTFKRVFAWLILAASKHN